MLDPGILIEVGEPSVPVRAGLLSAASRATGFAPGAGDGETGRLSACRGAGGSAVVPWLDSTSARGIATPT